jgi:hypothetical protein
VYIDSPACTCLEVHKYTVYIDSPACTCLEVYKYTVYVYSLFDNKRTFNQHIKYLKDRCIKALNLLHVVAHKDWEADCATLIKLYRFHVRSKLDYGCVVYGSAQQSVLESLDRVHNAPLRTLFSTSPVSNIHVEAGELLLELRCQQLCLQYISKLSSNPRNPAFGNASAVCLRLDQPMLAR